jgi:hypothetical protein
VEDVVTLEPVVAEQVAERIGPAYLGVLIPLAVFILASLATWILYRRFSRGEP